MSSTPKDDRTAIDEARHEDSSDLPPTILLSDRLTPGPDEEKSDSMVGRSFYAGLALAVFVYPIMRYGYGVTGVVPYIEAGEFTLLTISPLLPIVLCIRHKYCSRKQSPDNPAPYEYVFNQESPRLIRNLYVWTRAIGMTSALFTISLFGVACVGHLFF